MVSGIIAVAGASGWLLSYLQFNDQALAFVTSISKDPTAMLLVMDAVMIVLGTFVDSLAILLVFAPAAIQISQA
jgi:TRAP-type C4-dicarboxylate transport system permease large subunit